MEQMNNNMICKVKGPGTTLMKVSGILMVVFGSIAIVVQLFTQAATQIGSALFALTGTEGQAVKAAFDSLGNAYLVALLAAITALVAGILALVFCRKPGKGLSVIIFCALSIVLALAYNFMALSSYSKIMELAKEIPAFTYETSGSGFGFANILALASSVLLPALATIGVLQNKKVS